jgi:hypothetical protein
MVLEKNLMREIARFAPFGFAKNYAEGLLVTWPTMGKYDGLQEYADIELFNLLAEFDLANNGSKTKNTFRAKDGQIGIYDIYQCAIVNCRLFNLLQVIFFKSLYDPIQKVIF